MRYLTLACDYDGTLATHGRVNEETLGALERLRGSGRKLILVTGRELPDLQTVFPALPLFDQVVAENGALLYRPHDKEEKVLGTPPPPEFLEALRRKGVGPLSVGHVIVATWHPHETAVLEAIRDLGLELQVIFNKDAVMVLPAGVNKATGLAAALAGMGLSPHNVVGVGDAENDHAFLNLCECAVAVANALPMLKDHADLVTQGDHGAGVIELIDRLLADDLHELEPRLTRHHILLGTRDDGGEVRIPPSGGNVLIAGSAGGGKSTLTTGLLERLAEKKYQFCVLDPEGDYENFEGAVTFGTRQHAPSVDEVMQVLRDPGRNAVVNLVGLPLADRPPFLLGLLPRLLDLRARSGRPHRLVLDEAHHLLPASWEPGTLAVPRELDGVVLVTVEPATVSPAALAAVGTVVTVGPSAAQALSAFCSAVGQAPPRPPSAELETGRVLYWARDAGAAPFPMTATRCRAVRHRHSRKYAEGELPPDRSFYFRGPEGRLNLRAQNLTLFLQLADGVDDVTWIHHLRQGDYSRWFRDAIKDESLAAEAARVEERADASPADSRAEIKAAVERLYTQPASAPLPMPGTEAAPRWS
jgi:hydroxymethylpyrimidine pyrophosphatase-like HAD family hydrolase